MYLPLIWDNGSITWCFVKLEEVYLPFVWDNGSLAWCLVIPEEVYLPFVWDNGSLAWCLVKLEEVYLHFVWDNGSLAWCFVKLEEVHLPFVWDNGSLAWCLVIPEELFTSQVCRRVQLCPWLKGYILSSIPELSKTVGKTTNISQSFITCFHLHYYEAHTLLGFNRSYAYKLVYVYFEVYF